MVEGKIHEVELCEEAGEEMGSGEVGGIDVGIASDIDRDTMMILPGRLKHC